MKEILKKDLMKQLIESHMEVDELADFKKQQGIEKSWEPIMSEPGDEGNYKTTGQKFRSGSASGEHIGHKVIDKSTGTPVVIGAADTLTISGSSGLTSAITTVAGGAKIKRGFYALYAEFENFNAT